jgi:hypothetical protein
MLILIESYTKSLFMSMRWDDVSELRPRTGLLLIPQVIYEHGELRYDDTDRIKPNNSDKILPQCHFIDYKSQINWHGNEPGPPL